MTTNASTSQVVKDRDSVSNSYLKKSVWISNTPENSVTFAKKHESMEQKEIWKPIEGHERYDVSNLGRVKRHAFSYQSGRWAKKFTRQMPECICKKHNVKCRAIVYLDMKYYKVDELVARAFLNYGSGGYKKIVHKNGDPMDCRVDNLQIGADINVTNDNCWMLERDGLQKLYEVKRDGTVIRRRDGFVYSPCLNHKGYLKLRLSVPWSNHSDGRKPYTIHRLVAMMYLPYYSPNMQVNHKNGIKTDNRVENLEMVYNSENAAHAWRNLDKDARSRRMRTTRRSNKLKAVSNELELFNYNI